MVALSQKREQLIDAQTIIEFSLVVNNILINNC